MIQLRHMRDDDEDYMLLLEWLKDPEVSRFYSTHPKTLNDVKKKYRPRVINYGNQLIHNVNPLIIMKGDIPVGYLQYYLVDYEEYGLREWEEYVKTHYEHPYAVDIFLGGRKFLNHGIGTESLKILAEQLFNTTDCDVILIDPNALNERAISCYKKAGFKENGLMKNRDLYQGKYTDSILMSLSRSDFL